MIERTVEAVVVAWDGTVGTDRRALVASVRPRVLALTAGGVDVAVVSSADVNDVDKRLHARPSGPGRLWLCVNRGSEMFQVTPTGPELVHRRVASALEGTALDMAVARTVQILDGRGLKASVVGPRSTTRTIDLLPAPDRSGLSRTRIAGRAEVVRLATECAIAAGLDHPCVTGDTTQVEIGLTDDSHSMRELLSLLACRGVGPGMVLVVGAEFGPIDGVPGRDSALLVPEAHRAIAVSVGAEPGGLPSGVRRLGFGPPALIGLLDEQIRRRRSRRVPCVDEDPAWIVKEGSGDPLRLRVAETICTLGADGLATRGSVEEPAAGSTPLVLADGVYSGPNADELLPGPGWTALQVRPSPDHDERILDLRTGVLARTECVDGTALRTLRFAALGHPGVVALRAEAAVGRLRPGAPLQRPINTPMARGDLGERRWARTGRPDGPGVAALAEQRIGRDGSVRTVERLAAYVVDRRRQPALNEASDSLDAAAAAGFDRMLWEHRTAWATRWDAVDVRIPDDPTTELGVRFALFQLWCNVNRHDESAVGARGVSGTGYAGHVFWDADDFVLPAMVSIDPVAAGAMLRYRLRRLDAARAYAAASGCNGARFPWESAATGDDVTPRSGRVGGSIVPIRTGQQEDHITADVAWAADRCATWAGSTLGARRAELPLLVETARYWASRVRRDDDGSVHIDTVIGPDEYHESVNDNAYTNVMARWNLRAGADAAERTGSTAETRRWRELADGLVDGYDPATGRYEQFAGYFELKSLLVAQFAQPPFAADLLIGREQVAASQIIKQPDVLMLHHLVPGEVHPGSLTPNLDYYGPRTSHGSSLSPSVSAALLARAGRTDDALAMLGVALEVDTGDNTGMAAAGLHIANLAGVWQAMVGGFAGVSVHNGLLTIDPRLPDAWGSLEIRFRCLGRRVRLSVTRDDVLVQTDRPLRGGLAGEEPRTLAGRTSLGRPAWSGATGGQDGHEYGAVCAGRR